MPRLTITFGLKYHCPNRKNDTKFPFHTAISKSAKHYKNGYRPPETYYISGIGYKEYK